MSDGQKARLLPSGSNIWAWLSILCALGGCVLCYLIVDYYFRIAMLGPVLFLFGLLAATIAQAKSGSRSGLARIGLWLNLGLLMITGVFVVWLFFMIANGMPRG